MGGGNVIPFCKVRGTGVVQWCMLMGSGACGGKRDALRVKKGESPRGSAQRPYGPKERPRRSGGQKGGGELLDGGPGLDDFLCGKKQTGGIQARVGDEK